MLTIDQIRAAHGPKLLTLTIKEWGGDVQFRRLTAAEWAVIADLGNANDKTDAAIKRIWQIVAATAVNEDGSPLFSNVEDRWILDDSPTILMRIGVELLKFNRIITDGGTVQKNLPTGP